jgi:hypothetical protein
MLLQRLAEASWRSHKHAAAEQFLAAVEGEDLARGEGALGFSEADRRTRNHLG